jgi:hypothetical protein
MIRGMAIDPNAASIERLYTLLANGLGFDRIRDPRLEHQASLRAYEARQQVGITGSTPIAHPTQAERRLRLGPGWENIWIEELAVWNYDYLDPIQALVDYRRLNGELVGLLNSSEHRAVLDNTSYKHWGIGLYTELPEGQEEWHTRHYCVIWMARSVPPILEPSPDDPTFPDVLPASWYYAAVERLAALGVVTGYPDGTFRPNQPVTRAEVAAMID